MEFESVSPMALASQSVRLAVKAKSWQPSKEQWMLAAQCIQLEEKERIGKFYFKKDAKSALVGRLLMRYAVAKMLGCPCEDLRFDRTKKGKPFLTSPSEKCGADSDISFNISHQGQYVVFAGEKGRLVGVDVMNVEKPRYRQVSDFLDSMKKQLTSEEILEVKNHTNEEGQLKTFFRLWCLKESLVKALGTGIGFSVNRLNFSLTTKDLPTGRVTTDTLVDIDRKRSNDWSFEESLIEDHCVAVACKVADGDTPIGYADNSEPMQFHVMNITELLSGCHPLLGCEPDLEYWESFNAKEEQPR